MRSDKITKGLERAPARALLYATGLSREDLGKPFIGIASSFTDLIPGHIHMRSLERAIEKESMQVVGLALSLVSQVFVTELQWDTKE